MFNEMANAHVMYECPTKLDNQCHGNGNTRQRNLRMPNAATRRRTSKMSAYCERQQSRKWQAEYAGVTRMAENAGYGRRHVWYSPSVRHATIREMPLRYAVSRQMVYRRLVTASHHASPRPPPAGEGSQTIHRCLV